MRIPETAVQHRREFLQLGEHDGADLVRRLAVQNQLDHALFQLPRKRFAFEVVHVSSCRDSNNRLGTAGYRTYDACFVRYNSSISSFKFAPIRSRFSFPFAVSSPLSTVNGLLTANGKLKRDLIGANLKDEIEELYRTKQAS